MVCRRVLCDSRTRVSDRSFQNSLVYECQCRQKLKSVEVYMNILPLVLSSSGAIYVCVVTNTTVAVKLTR